MKKLSLNIAIICITTFLYGCGDTSSRTKAKVDVNVSHPDTLYAATLYGPTSYFNYRGLEMGFDYENVKRFADSEGMVLNLKVATSLQALLRMVIEGKVDLAAYPVPIIEEYNKIVRHCGHKEITWQVLVQPDNKKRISDVTELVGKTIYVEKDSKYHYRLLNLDQELGGGIDIIPISRDSLITEDLIEMVDCGEIPLTIVDSDIAELNKSYYPRLDIGMKISLDQYASWAVRKDCDSLASRLDRWEKRHDNSEILRSVYKKYFEISKNTPCQDPARTFGINFKTKGHLSPFDNLFRRHSCIPGYDWRLLAAIGFNESRFDNNVESWAGAQGIMQLMPETAKAVGIGPEQLRNPDINILAAARLLNNLDKALADKVPDPDERIKFVVAAYNCGLGHIYDAIELAYKHGLNPEIWLGNVSEAALLKSRPQYYNDPVVKNGYFRGRETTEFVERVLNTYEYFKSIVK